MKALSYLLVLALSVLSSCTSSLYTGAEYDDLYYSSTDRPIVKNKSSVNEQIAEGNLKANDYYNNVYAADTLISDQNSNPADTNYENYNNNDNNGGGYDYYNDYPYAGRLRRFYGNYFDPYWRDPFYFDWGYPSFGYGFGYGGFPYYSNFYNPYFWDYGYGGFYGDYYGGFYGGYYGGFGSYYSPYGYYYRERNSVPYGRRERPSSMSSRWNNNSVASGSSRRDPYLSSGENSGVSRRTAYGTQTVPTAQRRAISSNGNNQQVTNTTSRSLNQEPGKGENLRTNTSTQRNPANMRPEYNSVNRTYTPSYSNPRMSTRPSYNNSRVTDGTNSGVNRNNGVGNNNRVYNNNGSVRTPSQGSQNSYNNVRSNSSVNGVQRRSFSPSNNSVRYSVPSRRSAESRSGYSSGGSYRSSSSGSGSSGSVSRSSYSSGSSSRSSSGSSSSSHSSSGRR